MGLQECLACLRPWVHIKQTINKETNALTATNCCLCSGLILNIISSLTSQLRWDSQLSSLTLLYHWVLNCSHLVLLATLWWNSVMTAFSHRLPLPSMVELCKYSIHWQCTDGRDMHTPGAFHLCSPCPESIPEPMNTLPENPQNSLSSYTCTYVGQGAWIHALREPHILKAAWVMLVPASKGLQQPSSEERMKSPPAPDFNHNLHILDETGTRRRVQTQLDHSSPSLYPLTVLRRPTSRLCPTNIHPYSLLPG